MVDWKRHAHGDVTLFEKDGIWQASEFECWLPGLYTSEEAARYAVTMHPSVLEDAWSAVSPRPITLEELADAHGKGARG